MIGDRRGWSFVDAEGEPVCGLNSLMRAVPVMILLHMFDATGENIPEARLAACEWRLVIAEDFNAGTPPLLESTKITASGNTLQIVMQDMNTRQLIEFLGERKSAVLGAELTGKIDGIDTEVIQFKLTVRNRRDSTGTPTQAEREYFTKAEAEELFELKGQGSQGPQGDKGDPGPAGPQGPKGDKGDRGTIGPEPGCL